MPLTDTQRTARQIIRFYREDPKRWTKGTFARPSKRSRVALYPDDKRATCWCITGALERVCTKERSVVGFWDTFRSVIGQYPVDFNDHPKTQWRDVRAALQWLADGRTDLFPSRTPIPSIRKWGF